MVGGSEQSKPKQEDKDEGQVPGVRDMATSAEDLLRRVGADEFIRIVSKISGPSIKSGNIFEKK